MKTKASKSFSPPATANNGYTQNNVNQRPQIPSIHTTYDGTADNNFIEYSSTTN